MGFNSAFKGLKVQALRHMTTCLLVNIYRRFGETSSFCIQFLSSPERMNVLSFVLAYKECGPEHTYTSIKQMVVFLHLQSVSIPRMSQIPKPNFIYIY